MIQLRKATPNDLETVLEARYRTLRAVFSLNEDYVFDEDFRAATWRYFEKEDQTTVLAFQEETVVGCATICYMTVVPTPDHPTGKRAHIMNVHTEEAYRRQGIGRALEAFLINWHVKNGYTPYGHVVKENEISLKMQESMGFYVAKNPVFWLGSKESKI